MNGVDLFAGAVIIVCLAYLARAAAATFKRDTEAQLRVATNYYTDADTYHRKPVAVSGSDGHDHHDSGTGTVPSDSRPRTIHRHDVGYRPRPAAPVGAVDSSDAEAVK